MARHQPDATTQARFRWRPASRGKIAKGVLAGGFCAQTRDGPGKTARMRARDLPWSRNRQSEMFPENSSGFCSSVAPSTQIKEAGRLLEGAPGVREGPARLEVARCSLARGTPSSQAASCRPAPLGQVSRRPLRYRYSYYLCRQAPVHDHVGHSGGSFVAATEQDCRGVSRLDQVHGGS